MDKQEYQARVAWLRRYRDAVRKRKNLVLRLHEAKDAAIHISPAMSSVRCQNTDGVSATQRAVERIEDAQEKLLEQEKICSALRIETKKAIFSLEDKSQRSILLYKYIFGLSVQHIAEQERMSMRWVTELHNRAVKNICLDICLDTSQDT